MRTITNEIIIDEETGMSVEEIRISPRNKYYRVLEERRRLRKLFSKTKNIYGVGAYFSKYKNRICKDSVNSKSVRKMCNRRFRRRLNQYRYATVPNGAAYRKHEEYWWSVT